MAANGNKSNEIMTTSLVNLFPSLITNISCFIHVQASFTLAFPIVVDNFCLSHTMLSTSYPEVQVLWLQQDLDSCPAVPPAFFMCIHINFLPS